MGENMCVSWSHQFQIPISIVRPFHTYGPGMDLTDGRVYADFVSDIIHNRDIVMKSDGLAKRAFCYLTDATLGFFKVLLEGKDREAYNIGNPDQEISILNLAEKLVKLFPEKKLQVVKYETVAAGYLKSNVNRNAPDIAKAKNLGWFPKVSIENGFKRTVENYL
jgi:nucleoside-diphosphate-sugar epimerase